MKTMLEGKDLILATKPFAKEIRSKSWFHTITTLLCLLLVYPGIALLPSLLLRILCSVLAGLLLIRMFIIYHDHQHHTILKNSFTAQVLMKAFGLFMLSPASIWKRSHDHHHQHNSKLFSASIGSYPILTKSKFLELSRKHQLKYLATRHPLIICLGYLSMFVYGMCIRSFLSNPRKHYDSLIALLLHVVFGILVYTFLGTEQLLLVFFLPYFIAFAMGAYLFYAQHNFPGVTFHENKNWVYEKAALESSSYMKMHPIMEWFTGNIGYHHIHHLNARIPFYRLPEVMYHFEELQNCKTTSWKLKDMSACLRLKVWDTEQNKMISTRELIGS
ncbi:MAG: fatty acid desaturase family protein [Flavisolibacter sp.]